MLHFYLLLSDDTSLYSKTAQRVLSNGRKPGESSVALDRFLALPAPRNAKVTAGDAGASAELDAVRTAVAGEASTETVTVAQFVKSFQVVQAELARGDRQVVAAKPPARAVPASFDRHEWNRLRPTPSIRRLGVSVFQQMPAKARSLQSFSSTDPTTGVETTLVNRRYDLEIDAGTGVAVGGVFAPASTASGTSGWFSEIHGFLLRTNATATLDSSSIQFRDEWSWWELGAHFFAGKGKGFGTGSGVRFFPYLGGGIWEGAMIAAGGSVGSEGTVYKDATTGTTDLHIAFEGTAGVVVNDYLNLRVVVPVNALNLYFVSAIAGDGVKRYDRAPQIHVLLAY